MPRALARPDVVAVLAGLLPPAELVQRKSNPGLIHTMLGWSALAAILLVCAGSATGVSKVPIRQTRACWRTAVSTPRRGVSAAMYPRGTTGRDANTARGSRSILAGGSRVSSRAQAKHASRSRTPPEPARPSSYNAGMRLSRPTARAFNVRC